MTNQDEQRQSRRPMTKIGIPEVYARIENVDSWEAGGYKMVSRNPGEHLHIASWDGAVDLTIGDSSEAAGEETVGQCTAIAAEFTPDTARRVASALVAAAEAAESGRRADELLWNAGGPE